MTTPVTQSSQQPKLTERKVTATPVFKYYIHDTADGYRLQLQGDFTDHQVSELNCCWMTARNTLKGRKLILDLRGVRRVDERGKQWLAGMALEGASYVPESFLRDALAGDSTARVPNNPSRVNLLERLVSVFRGSLPSTE